ncbi:MAG: 30S ribosomal protein S8 [Candidatus Saganbacteria bacterium]|nr:30S ribosomal protein S8 [Candidatus Saganbacteria bacterium]
MYLTDSIGDMLTRIRNALSAKKEFVDIPASRVKEAIAKILEDEGFISKYETKTVKGKEGIRIILKYGPEWKQVIKVLRRVSTPGRRVYVGSDSIPKVLRGFGTAIVSTSKGLMTGEEAKKARLGGELLLVVW